MNTISHWHTQGTRSGEQITAGLPAKKSRNGFLRWRLHLVVFAVALSTLAGCQTPTWNLPVFAIPQELPFESADAKLAIVESTYATAVNLESIGNSNCVDHYYDAAKLCWHELTLSLENGEPNPSRYWEIYHSSVGKLISTSLEYDRFDPLAGLEINTEHGIEHIPVSYHGFLWSPEDFNEFVLVGDNECDHLPESFRAPGLGVPLIVKRIRSYDEPMRKKEQLFAATAIIRSQPDDSQTFSLEFYEPGSIPTLEMPAGTVPLARDLSAPFVYRLDTKGDVGLQAFRSVGSTANATGLYSITPYQPGKIPLIFVHGLLSDPTTWITMGAAILADPEIKEKYQIWAFEYQTGDAFTRSGKIFRADLAEARDVLDPDRLDPAFDNMVVIGHSMGGLVTKLQITSSETLIWDSISNKPFDELVGSDEMKLFLAETCFFEPQPSIARVIFIGTPHQGANGAQRLAGKIASAMVKEPEDRKIKHRQLIADNPGMFSKEVEERIPNSIDLLQPKSDILQAVQELPISHDVALHTILGVKQYSAGPPGDGVVPVTSARHTGVRSELMVQAKHTQLQSKPESIAEVFRILRLHQIRPENVLASKIDAAPTAMNFSDTPPAESPTLLR